MADQSGTSLRTGHPDLCSGPLFSKILIYALPIMLTNVLQLLFNAVGMIVVGRYSGSEALAAVGATSELINLIVNLFLAFSVGASVVLAQDYGAGKPDEVNCSVHTAIAISIIGGLLLMGLGLIFCTPLLVLLGTPADIIGLSTLYMRIYFLGIPASMIYNFGAAILRAVGDSRRPMGYLLLSGSLNVLLSLFFVLALHRGVDGVAWAAAISQYAAMVLIIICLCRSEGMIRLDLRRLRIDRRKLKQMVWIGLPAGLQSLLFSVSNVLIQSAVNSFGSTLVAANSAARNIEGFISTTMNAYYIAAVTFTGQHMGARKYARIDAIAKAFMVLVLATWLLLGGAMVLFSRPLVSLYTTDPVVIELGMLRLNIMMAAYFACGVLVVLPGLIRGMGYSVLPMICTLTGACLMRIVWLVTFFAWKPTVVMLFLCYPVTWVLTAIALAVSFFYVRRQVRLKAGLPISDIITA